MVLASALALPLWLLGIAVAVIVYLAIAFLIFRAVHGARRLVRAGRQSSRVSRRASLYDGQAHPTLLDVAVSRAASAPAQHRSTRPPRSRGASPQRRAA